MAQAHTGTVRETGVPLGGVDTGYLLVYPDGTWSELRLPGDAARNTARVMPGAFAALRVEQGPKIWTRLLADAAGAPNSVSGTQPAGLPAASYKCVRQFPKAAFTLNEAALPIAFEWTWHTSVIPYDYGASCMPAIFLRAELRNTSEERVKCSVLLNMAPPPTVSGEPFHNIMPVLVEYEEQVKFKPEDGSGVEEKDQGPVRNGIVFGGAPDGSGPAMTACLTARAWNGRFTTAVWNPLNAIEEARLWEDFGEIGRLPRVAVGREPSHGAVCCDFSVNPGEKRHVVFVYAWYHRQPPAKAPAYAALWGNVRDVARHGLRHAGYLLGAVDDWQNLHQLWHAQVRSSLGL